ncbi:MAG: N-acetylglucosamine kinase [Bacteroidales bacterium]|nr:N-acetylglucosamine kinase [Bacteroidales bacterium]
MILIADSGATTTSWCALDGKFVFATFESEGYNPNYITLDYMVEDIRKSLPLGFPTAEVDHVFFYGAGVTELQYGFVRKAIAQVMPNAETFVAMDLLASARALLGRKAGFAAILGTGTNSCLYDGEKITLNIDSLGFILGDEGSGAYMGKRMLVDYVRGRVSEDARRVIASAVPYSGDEIIDIIYTKPFPNRFCGQYGKLIHDNLSIPYFHDLAEDSFCQLFEQIISLYPDYKSYSFNCVGSVGWYFQDVLKPVVRRYGMEVGTLLKTPMEGLIRYHTEA